MLGTVAAILAFKNDAVGFIAGLVWHWGFRAAGRFEVWRERRDGRPFWRSYGSSYGESAGLLAQDESDRVA